MKNRLLFAALLAVSVLWGCGKGDAVDDSVPPLAEEPAKGSSGSEKTPQLVMASADRSFRIEDTEGAIVRFETNVDWSVAIEYDGEQTGWLTATPDSGSAGEYEVALAAETNTTEKERTATVNLRYGDRTARLEIVQDWREGPKLVMASADQSFHIEDANGIYILFEVNVDWTITLEYEGEDTGWLTATPDSGPAGEHEVALVAKTNTTEKERAAIVCLHYGDRTSRLEIIQGWKDGPKLEMRTPPVHNLPAEGITDDQSAFEVNRDWEIMVAYETPDTEWLTVTPTSGSAGIGVLNLTARANPSGVGRKAGITVSFGGRTFTIEVNQNGVNLAPNFDRQFAEELQRRGYIARAYHITPEEVKGIKSLQLHGGWNASEQRYMGKLTSLQGIEYFESLEDLTCWGNQLTSLDLSENKALVEVMCYSNRLETIDVSGCPALRTLYCRENRLTTIDVSRNPALSQFSCGNNLLSTIDVSTNSQLWGFLCEGNPLSSIDISRNPRLKTIFCSDTGMTSLDISNNPNVMHVQCYNNPGDGEFFPIYAWFDNETIPQTVKNPDERTPIMWFPTESWTYEGRRITPDYRKVK